MEYVWPLVPKGRRVCKAAALTVWMGPKYTPRTQETLDEVLKALEKVAPQWAEKVNAGEENFVPHLRTWLFQQRYMDED